MTNQPLPSLTAPVVGQPISQSYLTAQMYNPLSFLLNRPSCFLVANASQTLANSTSNKTLIGLDTATFDPYGGLSSSAWVVPVTGWYDVAGVVHFSGNTAGNRAVILTTDKVNLTTINGTEQFSNPGGSTMSVDGGGIVRLNQGDTLGLVAYQSSGVNLTTMSVGGVCASLKAVFVHA